MDPFGRPITRTVGDEALAADTAQAALAARTGFSPAYGGRRYVGDVRRGGLLGSPAVVFGLPVRAVCHAYLPRHRCTCAPTQQPVARPVR